MNVVDSSGWLEYFTGGPNARHFALPIQALPELLVPTLCMYEVFKRLLATAGEEAALQALGVMALGHEVDLTRLIAVEAAQISLALKLAMADSIILASARAHQAVLWTQDEHFKAVAGVRYFEKRRQ